MEEIMRRVFWVATVVVMALALASCGSTSGNDDEQVLDTISFDGEGITQCDQFVGSNLQVDVQQDVCSDDTIETFTDTFANANVQNNQKLDITINKYTVVVEGASLGTLTYNLTDTVPGKRCTNQATLSCAADRDCVTLGGVGTCQPSQTAIALLLFDIATKIRLTPDLVPFGRTLTVNITLFGTDVSGGDWQSTGSINAIFQDVDNCMACTLTQ